MKNKTKHKTRFLKLFITLITIIIFNFPTSGQIPSKLTFLDGKTKNIDYFELNEPYVFYKIHKKNKIMSADSYDVYSITDSNDVEIIIYKPDTATEFSIFEMKEFIKGEQWAMQEYKNPLDFWGGFSSGVVGSYFAHLYGVGLAVPFFYPKVNIALSKNFNLDEQKYLTTTQDTTITNLFKEGYEDKVKTLKVKRSLIGGIVGVTVGVTVINIIVNNQQ